MLDTGRDPDGAVRRDHPRAMRRVHAHDPFRRINQLVPVMGMRRNDVRLRVPDCERPNGNIVFAGSAPVSRLTLFRHIVAFCRETVTTPWVNIQAAWSAFSLPPS